MADIIRKSELLQLFVDIMEITEENLRKAFEEDPRVTSVEYTNGILIIKTVVDSAPIIIDIKLKDSEN